MAIKSTSLVNPGQELRNLLKKLCSSDSHDSDLFIYKIDHILKAEGELTSIIYDSSINYLLRRLITTAGYLKRKCDQSGLPERIFIIQLRDFLKEETRIPSREREKVLALLRECLRVHKRQVTSKTLKRIRRLAMNSVGKKAQSGQCYICGQDLDFEQADQINSAEVEHVWPNAMGGANNDSNLKLSCQRCNKAKANYIDASDFHYEEICLVSDKGDDSFDIEMRADYKVALWTRSNYKCVICGKPASYVGELEFGRRNPNDSWHFLNIEAYCTKHTPK